MVHIVANNVSSNVLSPVGSTANNKTGPAIVVVALGGFLIIVFVAVLTLDYCRHLKRTGILETRRSAAAQNRANQERVMSLNQRMGCRLSKFQLKSLDESVNPSLKDLHLKTGQSYEDEGENMPLLERPSPTIKLEMTPSYKNTVDRVGTTMKKYSTFDSDVELSLYNEYASPEMATTSPEYESNINESSKNFDVLSIDKGQVEANSLQVNEPNACQSDAVQKRPESILKSSLAKRRIIPKQVSIGDESLLGSCNLAPPSPKVRSNHSLPQPYSNGSLASSSDTYEFYRKGSGSVGFSRQGSLRSAPAGGSSCWRFGCVNTLPHDSAAEDGHLIDESLLTLPSPSRETLPFSRPHLGAYLAVPDRKIASFMDVFSSKYEYFLEDKRRRNLLRGHSCLHPAQSVSQQNFRRMRPRSADEVNTEHQAGHLKTRMLINVFRIPLTRVLPLGN